MAIYQGVNKVADLLPEVDNTTNGKFLTNNGTDTSWGDVLPALPATGTYTLKVVNGTLTWVEG